MKLLIADDHDINLKLLCAQLEAEGHAVVQACDGVEALAALEHEAFDGVISDILMPRMDGYRLCMEVRGRPELASLPFILYTSTYNSKGDRELAESLGADAYIAKPAPTSRILAAIMAAADKARTDEKAERTFATEPAPLMKQYNEVLIRKLEEKGLELERTHEGLLESQAKLSGLIASALDAIIAVDEEHRIVLFNAAAGLMFRCDPTEAIGRPLNAFIPSRSRETHDRHMAAFAIESEVERRMGPRDVIALRADGTEFLIEANISRLDTSRGQLFTAFIRDVTDRHRAQIALKKSEAGLRRAQDVAQMAHAVVNSQGDVEERSHSFAALLGIKLASLPRTQAEWTEYIHEDDRANVLQAANDARHLGRRSDLEYRLRRGNEWRKMRHIIEPLDINAEDGPRTFNTIQDVTIERQAEDKIRQLNRVYAVLGAINSLIVRVNDRDELFQQACNILVETGKFSKAWIGITDEGIKPMRIMACAGAQEEFFNDLQNRLISNADVTTGVLARVLKSGKPIICNDIANDATIVEQSKMLQSGSRSFSLLPLVINERTIGVISIHSAMVGFFDEEEVALLLGLANDVAFAIDHLMKAERISYLANHDALTSLPNRSLFSDLLTQKLAEPEYISCVALLDMVRFRRINETLGRHAGDQLLLQVAARLRCVDPFVARLGSDLFALQFNERRTASELVRDFEHVHKTCFENPFLIGDEEVRMGCRIGAAVFPGDGDDAETLLLNAESALRQARTSMQAFVFYAAAMNANANEALTMESKLRRAIEREEFVLHYQPKVRFEDRKICGVEALIRWQDPNSGLVPPIKFISVLEETGLIGTVGKWALNRALSDLADWRAAGAPPIRVAVNVSPLQLNQPNFAEQIATLVGEGHGENLELEITESVIMDDVDQKIAMLKKIRALGVSISVDDFGTGYSSLSYITHLPITSLKIDRAFITGMNAGPDGYTLVSSIIALAHALKLKVVAEGVENQAQAQVLSLLQCDEAQGFLFSKPLPASELKEILLSGRPLP